MSNGPKHSARGECKGQRTRDLNIQLDVVNRIYLPIDQRIAGLACGAGLAISAAE
jgi:hypothetical protein